MYQSKVQNAVLNGFNVKVIEREHNFCGYVEMQPDWLYNAFCCCVFGSKNCIGGVEISVYGKLNNMDGFDSEKRSNWLGCHSDKEPIFPQKLDPLHTIVYKLEVLTAYLSTAKEKMIQDDVAHQFE